MNEIELTPAELATIRHDLAACEREAAINEAAKRVAEAAVALVVVRNAHWRLDWMTEGTFSPRDYPEAEILLEAEGAAICAVSDSIREYRALTESQGKENNEK